MTVCVMSAPKAINNAMAIKHRHAMTMANGIPPIAPWDAMTVCVMSAPKATNNAMAIKFRHAMTMASGIPPIAPWDAMTVCVMSAPKAINNAMAIKFRHVMIKANGSIQRLANPPKHVMQAFAVINAQMKTTDVPAIRFRSARIRIGTIPKLVLWAAISTMDRHTAKRVQHPTQKRSAMATPSKYAKMITNGKILRAAQMAATAPTEIRIAKNARHPARKTALTIISKHAKMTISCKPRNAPILAATAPTETPIVKNVQTTVSDAPII